MAGLNFVFSFDGAVKDYAPAYEAAIKETLCEDSHRVETLFESDQVLLSSSGYEGYFETYPGQKDISASDHWCE